MRLDISALEMIARRGAELASFSISAFLRRTVTLSVASVELEAIETIPELLGGSEVVAVGLVSRVSGDIEGNAALMFERGNAFGLIKILSAPAEVSHAGEISEYEKSILEETANITVSSFMNSLAAHFDIKCVPNAPGYLMDLAGAILTVILMESAEHADNALVISTGFECRDENIKALFVFLPSPASFDRLREGLSGE